MPTIYIISVVVSVIVMIACQFIDAKLINNGSFSIPMAIMICIFSLIPLFNLCASVLYIVVLLIGLVDSGRFEINVTTLNSKSNQYRSSIVTGKQIGRAHV